MARSAAGLPGKVSPGTDPGDTATLTANATSTPAAAIRPGEATGASRSAEIIAAGAEEWEPAYRFRVCDDMHGRRSD
jgi:hypothetical protein